MRNTRTRTLTLVLAAIVAIGGAGVLSAQQAAPGQTAEIDPNSAEFDQFVEAMVAVQEIQAEMSESIATVIDQSPLNEERFMEIHQQQQFGEGSMDIPEEEQVAYEELAAEINTTQQSFQQEMIDAVEDRDMTVDRFNSIVYTVQQDPALREALNDAL
jgi:hypothetical protein